MKNDFKQNRFLKLTVKIIIEGNKLLQFEFKKSNSRKIVPYFND